jgi:hypothetical protein
MTLMMWRRSLYSATAAFGTNYFRLRTERGLTSNLVI